MNGLGLQTVHKTE